MNLNAFEPGVLIFTIYFFLLLIVTLFRYNKTNQENKKIFIFFVLLQILIGGLRSYTVGTDTGSYVDVILKYSTFSIEEIIKYRAGRDPYFYVFTRVITQVFSGYTWLFFVLQIVFWWLVSQILYNYSRNCLLALLLLVASRQNYFALSAMRQGIAMALVIYSFRYLETKRTIRYFLTIILAFFCHKSAIIYLPVFFIDRFRLNKMPIVLALFPIALALSFVLPDISFDEEDFAYARYLDNEGRGNYFSILTTIMAFVFIFYRVLEVKLNSKMNILFSFSLLAAVSSIMAFKIGIAYRVSAYFAMFLPIIMSNLLVEKKYYKNDLGVLCIVLIILYIITGMPPGLDDYKFFWQTDYFNIQ